MSINQNLLNFKFGQYKNLASAPLTAGTVYVTTDEKAMYIDLPDKNGTLDRMRLGDIIVYDNVDDILPPYHKGAFYYCSEERALLRYEKVKGKEDQYQWVQINATADVVDKIEALKTSLTTKIDGLVEKDTQILNKFNDYVTTSSFNEFVNTNTQTISGLDAAYKAADVALGGRIDSLSQTLNNRIDGVVNTTIPGVKSELEGKIGEKVAQSDYNGFVTTTNDAIADIRTKYAQADNNLNSKIESLSETVNGKIDIINDTTLPALKNELQDEIKGKVSTSTYEEFVDDANTRIGNLDTAYKAADVTLGSRIDSLSETLNGKIDTINNTTIPGVKSELEGKIGEKVAQSDYDAYVDSNDKAISALDTAYKAADVTLGGRIDSLSETLNGKIDTINNTTIPGVKSELEGQIAEKVAQSVYNEYVEATGKTISDLDAAYKAADEILDGKIGSLSTTLNGKIDTINNTTIPGVKSDLEGQINNKVAQSDYNTYVEATEKTIADLDAAYKKADGDLNDSIKSLSDTVNGKIDTINNTTIPGVKSELEGKIAEKVAQSDYDAQVAATGKTISDLDTAYKAADNALSGRIESLSTTVSGRIDTIEGNYVKKDGTVLLAGDFSFAGNEPTYRLKNVADPTEATDVANARYVATEIANAIKANDAMTFKGLVGGDFKLPLYGEKDELPEGYENYVYPQVGDTYKVAYTGSIQVKENLQAEDASIDAKIGDLFINAAESDEDTPVWVHISSGYEETYLQKFISDSNSIYISDGIGTEVSNGVNKITFVGSSSSNIVINVSKETTLNGETTVETGNHIVTASMVWGTFDPPAEEGDEPGYDPNEPR